MHLKVLITRWIAHRIENRTRVQRRALRDYHRLESQRIREQEIRTRGLRLYVAWSRPQIAEQAQPLSKASAWDGGLPHAA